MLGQRKTIGGIIWVGLGGGTEIYFPSSKIKQCNLKKFLLKVELSASSGTYQSIALKLYRQIVCWLENRVPYHDTRRQSTWNFLVYVVNGDT